MTTKKPRVNVTFTNDEYEILCLLSRKRHQSISAFVRLATQNWLQEFEDFRLSNLAEEAEKKSEGKKTYSIEEVCQMYDIQLN